MELAKAFNLYERYFIETEQTSKARQGDVLNTSNEDRDLKMNHKKGVYFPTYCDLHSNVIHTDYLSKLLPYKRPE